MSPTYNTKSKILRKAAQAFDWSTFRFQGNSFPGSYSSGSTDHVIYCTVPKAFFVARHLNSILMGCSGNWLPDLRGEFLNRTITLQNLGDKKCDQRKPFIKPVPGKSKWDLQSPACNSSVR